MLFFVCYMWTHILISYECETEILVSDRDVPIIPPCI